MKGGTDHAEKEGVAHQRGANCDIGGGRHRVSTGVKRYVKKLVLGKKGGEGDAVR